MNIFWSKGDDFIAHKLVLPVDASGPEATPETLQRFVVDCDPGSFGRSEKDVLDSEYRRAGIINLNQILENIG
jgi:hypothetical protein